MDAPSTNPIIEHVFAAVGQQLLDGHPRTAVVYAGGGILEIPDYLADEEIETAVRQSASEEIYARALFDEGFREGAFGVAVGITEDGAVQAFDLPFSRWSGMVGAFFSVDEDVVLVAQRPVWFTDQLMEGEDALTAVSFAGLPPDQPGTILIRKLRELWST